MKTLVFPRLDTATETESDVLVVPEIDGPGNSGDGYRVILYNDDHTPVDAVIEQVIKATQCSRQKSIQITIEAHEKGRAICYRGSRGKCQEVTKILREIRLQCEVDCD
jgi:ATP-dependent Clp protease adaptor protein ClpS